MSCKECNTPCYEQGSDGKMCMAWTKKPMTNADRIRSMTDEELLYMIAVNCDCECCSAMFDGKPCRTSNRGCLEVWNDWLKEEAKQSI